MKSAYPERHNIYGDFNGTIDVEGHGTAVAYTIEKNTPDSVKIIPYKTPNINNQICYSALNIAIDNAVDKGADIINFSIGFEGKNKEFWNKTLYNTHEAGVAVVVAAGNEGKNISNTGFYPSCNDYVVTVAATNKTTSENTLESLKKAGCVTNYGECVDISAPGEEIWCAYNLFNMLTPREGTSFAAPLVTSALAILKSAKPDLTLMQCESILKNNVTVPDEWIAGSYGTGVVNVKKMFENSLSDLPKITLSSSGAVITAENNAIIFYTTDGTIPVAGVSPVYTSPIDTLRSNIKTICAIACENGKLPSCTVEAKLKWEDKINITYKQKVKIKLAADRSCRYCYSTDESVATVDEDGYLTGVSSGKTKVVVETFDNRRCEYLVTVRYSLPQWIIILFLFGFIWYI
ncbi:MAG: S8 family serine peptidase [Clostridia bacterium]|nr:S8 family serine peptidase [Clostridia bacterium]